MQGTVHTSVEVLVNRVTREDLSAVWQLKASKVINIEVFQIKYQSMHSYTMPYTLTPVRCI